MKKVLPVMFLAFVLGMTSCQKDEEVLPIEQEVSGIDQSIDYVRGSKPRPYGIDQSIDYVRGSKPRPYGIDQSIDYVRGSKPRPY